MSLIGTTTAKNEPKPSKTIIEATHGWTSLRLYEVWEARELLYFLVWRDLVIRYKQTIVGVLWAIITPVTSMIIFSVFLGGLAQIPSDGIPYPLFSFAALVPWGLFANAVERASTSVVANNSLVTKVYFPRLVIPLAGVFSSVVDFVIAFGVLLVIMLLYGRLPTLNVIWLPFFVLLSLVASLGVGLWLAALNVRFRDVRYVIPFLMQAWMFATPIVYSSSLLKNETLKILYSLNPMTGVVEGFRWALLGTNAMSIGMLVVSTTLAIVVLVTGVFYFKRTERVFADLV